MPDLKQALDHAVYALTRIAVDSPLADNASVQAELDARRSYARHTLDQIADVLKGDGDG